MSEKVDAPWSNGSSYDHWVANNCDECRFRKTCRAFRDTMLAYGFDGRLQKETLEFIGDGYKPCPHLEIGDPDPGIEDRPPDPDPNQMLLF